MKEDTIVQSEKVPVPDQVRGRIGELVKGFDKFWVAIVIAQEVMKVAAWVQVDQAFEPVDAILDSVAQCRLRAPTKIKDVATKHKRVRLLDGRSKGTLPLWRGGPA